MSATTLSIIFLALAVGSSVGWLCAHFSARRSRATAAFVRAAESVSCNRATLLDQGEVVEVQANALPGPDGPLTSPYTQTPCLRFYAVTTETRMVPTVVPDGQGKGGTTVILQQQTTTVDEQESDRSFLLSDITGTVEVSPAGAQVYSIKSEDAHDGDRHLQEWIIPLDSKLYVIGVMREGRIERGGERFIISTGGEDELIAGAEKSARNAQRLRQLATALLPLCLLAAAYFQLS